MSIGADDFFCALYARSSGLLELTPQPSHGRQFAKTPRLWLPVAKGVLEDVDVLHRHIEDTIANQENAFFGLATRREAGNGTAENLRTLPALIVDFDHRGDPNRIERTRREIHEGPTPSIVVSSGGGWHGYWLLDPPLEVSTAEGVAAAKLSIGRLAAYFSVACRGALKVTQYMRIPGSANPRDSPPRFAAVDEGNFRPEWCWSLDELMQWCPREPLKATGIVRVGGQSVEAHLEAYNRLRRAYLRRLELSDMLNLKGVEVSEARHGTCVALAGLLHNGEHDAEELAAILEVLWDAYFSRSPNPGEIENIAEHTVQKEPFKAKTNKEWFIENSNSLTARIIRRQRAMQATV